jgi:hypothetical protein
MTDTEAVCYNCLMIQPNQSPTPELSTSQRLAAFIEGYVPEVPHLPARSRAGIYKVPAMDVPHVDGLVETITLTASAIEDNVSGTQGRMYTIGLGSSMVLHATTHESQYALIPIDRTKAESPLVLEAAKPFPEMAMVKLLDALTWCGERQELVQLGTL